VNKTEVMRSTRRLCTFESGLHGVQFHWGAKSICWIEWN